MMIEKLGLHLSLQKKGITIDKHPNEINPLSNDLYMLYFVEEEFPYMYK